MLLVACERFGGQQHLVDSKEQRETMAAQAEERAKLAQADVEGLNRMAAQGASDAELEAVQFLYAYMPLCDLGAFPLEFVQEQALTALNARSEMKWGKKVTNELFLHYVLPFRAADEHVDAARVMFYDELKDKVQGKSMADAAMEVGLWCRQQAAPGATSANRTSGSLTVIRAATGDRGELASLATAALRSVCIPARMVNTDNAAWTEALVDDHWYALDLSAPVLNLVPIEQYAVASAKTIVPGVYSGPEEWLSSGPYHTELNLQDGHSTAAPVVISIVDANGQSVEGAQIELLTMQKAELIPVARCVSKSNGKAELPPQSAVGMMLWASKDGQYALSEFDGHSSVTLHLQPASALPQGRLNLSGASALTTGTASADAVKRTQQADAQCAQRSNKFADPNYATQLARDKGISAISVKRALTLSRGNWEEIRNFITSLDGNGLTVGMALLDGLDERDLQLASTELLRSHLNAVDIFPSLVTAKQFSIFDRYILAPRIGREPLEKWREQIHEYFSFDEVGFFRNNPENVVQWLLEHVKIDNNANYANVPMSPTATLRMGVADALSRNTLFVAICRSFGVPARLTPVSQIPQYMTRNGWHTPMSLIANQPIAEQACINLSNANESECFSLSQLHNGRFVPINLGNITLPAQIDVEAGLFRLITRSANGECAVKHFEVPNNSTISIQL